MSETDAEFVERLAADRNGPIYEAEMSRLFALARRGVELQQIFDLRWKADQRAIKRWQAAHPGNDLVWPDRADMVVWLLDQLPPPPAGETSDE